MAGFSRQKGNASPNFDSLRNELKKGELKPVYVADGADHHRLRSFVEYIVNSKLDDSARQFNYHKFDGEQDEFAAVYQQAMSFPMMAATQVIWVRHADKLLSDIANENRLLKYVDNPPAESILILSADKFDGRRKWTKIVKTAGYFYDFSPPVGSDLISWTLKYSQSLKLPLTLELAELLVDLVGDDQQAIQMELEKLGAVLCDEKVLPDADGFRDIIMANRPVDPFELVKEMGPGRLRNGMIKLRIYLDEGRSPYEIAPLLIWRIKQVAQVHDLLEEGLNAEQIREVLGISPYSARQAIDVARTWSRENVRKSVRAIGECERMMKSSPLEPQQILEKAVIEICS